MYSVRPAQLATGLGNVALISIGTCLVNGRNLKTIAAADYAKMIGTVMHDDALFLGTVADNISFFDAPMDMERVKTAAAKANIGREIEVALVPSLDIVTRAEGAA